jgi:formylglycine-generating enzyme required for sulfatase activity
MGKYPVTQKQWRAVASLPKVERDLNPDPSNFKGDDRPVERVNWYDAVEFCKRLSKKTGREYRLPSEAEWEYACRAGTTTKFYFGETLTPKLARCKANFGMVLITLFSGETTPVGQFPPNAFGLYDLHGNVWEWCADTWHDNYVGAPTDGSAWTTGGNDNRSPMRGGSWGNNPLNCRSAYRNDYVSGRVNLGINFGFRVGCGSGRTL